MPRIAITQLKTSSNKNNNLVKILNYIKIAASQKADLCTFPEFMMFYNLNNKTHLLPHIAENLDGKFIKSIQYAAKINSINVIGTIYEKSKNQNKVYDTAFFINQNGKITSIYRKTHLYDAFGFKESNNLLSGSQMMKPIKTTVGKIGMLICYELRFPEISRFLALRGSEILVIPSAWIKSIDKMKEQHWLILNQTRAIENCCYIIAPNQTGNIYCGRSIVIDPLGNIILDMKKHEGIKILDIDLAKIKETRKILPLFKHRRTDLYYNH